MVSTPTGRVDVMKVAVLVRPGPGTSIAVPSSTPDVVGGNSSAKVTWPVGGAKLPVKVAVKVTGRPCGEGLGAPVRVATLVSGRTVMVTMGEVEAVWRGSPE